MIFDCCEKYESTSNSFSVIGSWIVSIWMQSLKESTAVLFASKGPLNLFSEFPQTLI